jgi:hypothetical protein
MIKKKRVFFFQVTTPVLYIWASIRYTSGLARECLAPAPRRLALPPRPYPPLPLLLLPPPPVLTRNARSVEVGSSTTKLVRKITIHQKAATMKKTTMLRTLKVSLTTTQKKTTALAPTSRSKIPTRSLLLSWYVPREGGGEREGREGGREGGRAKMNVNITVFSLPPFLPRTGQECVRWRWHRRAPATDAAVVDTRQHYRSHLRCERR